MRIPPPPGPKLDSALRVRSFDGRHLPPLPRKSKTINLWRKRRNPKLSDPEKNRISQCKMHPTNPITCNPPIQITLVQQGKKVNNKVRNRFDFQQKFKFWKSSKMFGLIWAQKYHQIALTFPGVDDFLKLRRGGLLQRILQIKPVLVDIISNIRE